VQSGIGVVFHGGGGTVYNDGSSIGDLTWDGGDLTNGWWVMRFDMQHNNSNLYTVRFRIYQSDATGALGTLKTEHIMYDVVNSNFGVGEALHGFFGTENSRFDVVDNYGFGNEPEFIPTLAQRFAGGDGTSEDPYRITTCQQLEAIGSDASLLSLHYILTSNIDCTATPSWHSGAGFKPIGMEFTGTFDGQGHTISGLYINSEDDEIGVFREIADGSYVQNVVLTDVDVTGDQGVGSIVGVSYGTIEDVTVSGVVEGRNEVGGLVGGNNGWDTVIDSTANVDVTGDWGSIGGLIGVNYGNVYGSVATGDVTGTYNVGGLVGSGNTGYEVSAQIYGSYATGAVHGYTNVGGLIGELGYTDLYQDYATGAITGVNLNDDHPMYLGGLVGYTFSTVAIDQSYYAGTITNGSYIGGLVGTAAGTSIDQSFAHVTVDATEGHQGGLVADADGVQITDSYAHAILGTGFYIGGLVGSGLVTVNNAYAQGSIASTNQVLGGIAGSVYNSSLDYVFAAVSIASINPLTVSGSIGGMNGGSLTNAYVDATINTAACETVQTIDNPSTIDCNPVNVDNSDPGYFKSNATNPPLDVWDFDTIWATTSEYPCLQWSDFSCFGSDDFNGDGTVDGRQNNISSYISSVTGKRIVIDAGENCELTTDDITTEGNLSAQDPAYIYDHGLFDFAGSCGDPGFTTTIKLYYYDVDAAALIARKYNPGTKAFTTIPGATIAQQTIHGSNVAVVTYELIDGGALDTDGAVNGEFTDPTGLARQVIGAPNTGLYLER